eukprot:9163831-Pyramimonas_sp.AAC.1
MDLPIRHYLPVRCVMIVSHLRVSRRAQRDDCVTPAKVRFWEGMDLPVRCAGTHTPLLGT